MTWLSCFFAALQDLDFLLLYRAGCQDWSELFLFNKTKSKTKTKTKNVPRQEEAQPMYTNYPFGVCLAHNGNLTNVRELKETVFTEARHINTDSVSLRACDALSILPRRTRPCQSCQSGVCFRFR